MNKLRLLSREWASRCILFLVVGGLLNAFIVATGFHDLTGVALWGSIAVALGLLTLQFMLGTSVGGNGLLLGLGCLLGYIAAVTGNITLATGGVVSVAVPDKLGQTGFEEAISGPIGGIDAVATQANAISGGLQSLSTISATAERDEAARGGTCGPSPLGVGPIYRVREHDKQHLAELAAQYATLAGQMTATQRTVDNAVASYTVARHAETAAIVNKGIVDARAIASSPLLKTIRADLETRLVQARTTTPDPVSGRPVRCPDAALINGLSQVLSLPVPTVPPLAELPPVPSHNTAVMGFAKALLRAMSGDTKGFGFWVGPMVAGMVPDLIFMLGIALRRRERRLRLGISGMTADGLRLRRRGWSGLVEAAALAAGDHRVREMAQYHHCRQRMFGRIDYLLIPAGGAPSELYLMCEALCAQGYATYGGRGPAAMLPPGVVPRPLDGERDVHFFVLRAKAWRTLLLEAVRDADAMPYGGDDGFTWQEAAE